MLADAKVQIRPKKEEKKQRKEKRKTIKQPRKYPPRQICLTLRAHPHQRAPLERSFDGCEQACAAADVAAGGERRVGGWGEADWAGVG
jgi:hypothetical protein